MAGDRMYRGRCAHAAFWMLLDSPLTSLDVHTLTCPAGCDVVLDSIEPPPTHPNGRS